MTRALAIAELIEEVRQHTAPPLFLSSYRLLAERLGVSQRTAEKYTHSPDFPRRRIVGDGLSPCWLTRDVDRWAANLPEEFA